MEEKKAFHISTGLLAVAVCVLAVVGAFLVAGISRPQRFALAVAVLLALFAGCAGIGQWTMSRSDLRAPGALIVLASAVVGCAFCATCLVTPTGDPFSAVLFAPLEGFLAIVALVLGRAAPPVLPRRQLASAPSPPAQQNSAAPIAGLNQDVDEPEPTRRTWVVGGLITALTVLVCGAVGAPVGLAAGFLLPILAAKVFEAVGLPGEIAMLVLLTTPGGFFAGALLGGYLGWKFRHQ